MILWPLMCSLRLQISIEALQAQESQPPRAKRSQRPRAKRSQLLVAHF